MRLRARSRWVRLLVGMVLVLITLPWAPAGGRPAPVHAAPGPDQVYIPPVTGTADAGVSAAEKEAISDAIQFLVAQELANKYPCASIATSADLANVLGQEKQKELLGATTPEQEADVLQSIAGALGTSTVVVPSYAMMGDVAVVTVSVMDTTTGSVVDKSSVTATGQGTDAFLDLAGAAVDKLSVGLCRSYWVGSISIIEDQKGGDTDLKITSHLYESVSLVPPRSLSKSTGNASGGSAQVKYQYTWNSHSHAVTPDLDSCNGKLQSITYTSEGDATRQIQGGFDAQVGVGVDRSSGTYTISIAGGGPVYGQGTEVGKILSWSKPPCGKVNKLTPPGTSGEGDAAAQVITGEMDSKNPNPYKLSGDYDPPPKTSGGMTTTIHESWSLTLKNPPKS